MAFAHKHKETYRHKCDIIGRFQHPIISLDRSTRLNTSKDIRALNEKLEEKD